MKLARWLSSFAFGVFIVLVATPAVRSGESLRVGMAEVDITPPIGYPMAGYFHERLATGTRDSLKARAIVFRHGDEQAALVVCDLGGIAVDLANRIRERAAEKTGIPRSNIVVAATHSHTAPDYFRDLYRSQKAPLDDERRAEYIRKLIDGPIRSIAEAHRAAVPVTLDAGTAVQTTPVSFNRRFVMRDGSVRTWARFSDPNVVRSAGPTDPQVGVLLVRAAKGGKALGVLSNFALHLDTLGGLEWSADFPFYIEETLRESLGPQTVSIFSAGACGDINHADPRRKERNKTDFIGKSIGATIKASLKKLRRVERTALRVRTREVRLPLRRVTKDGVKSAIATIDAVRRKEKVDFYDHVAAGIRILLDHMRNAETDVATEDYASWGLTRTWAGVGDSLPAEVQVMSIGDEFAIVALPGEIFVELGLAIKQGSPFRTTLVVELANSAETHYVPNRGAYAQGGYEVTNSALRAGAGEMLVEAALGLLREAASEKP
jgi:hypothetical protein